MKNTIELTRTQLAIYFESVSKAGEPVYILPWLLEIDPHADIERLRAAVAHTLARYPILAMTLETGADGMPRLTEGDMAKAAACEITDMSQNEFEQLKKELPRPFELNGGPLFEATIFRTPATSYLYMAMHHVISDGTTNKLVLNSIAADYEGKTPGCEAPMTMAEVSEVEKQLRESPLYAEAKEFYAEKAACNEADSMPLPDVLVEEKAPADDSLGLKSGHGDDLMNRSRELDVEYDRLFAFSREAGVPLSVVMDGAFGYLAGIWNAADESLFSTIYAGRDNDREREVAGMMVQTYPVFCSWDADTKVKDYLKSLAADHVASRKYSRAYSYAEFCSDTGLRPTLNFSYRGSVQSESVEVPGLFVQNTRPARFHYTEGNALQMLVDHIGDKLVLRVEYPAHKYTPEFIDSYMSAYETVLNEITFREKLTDIRLRANEMDDDDNGCPAVYDGTIVDLMRQQAASDPERVMAVSDGFEVSYGRVMELSGKLATYIASLGIGEGDAVAVMPRRDEWMLIATTGVLCSGAAYEPLDSSYPAERLNYMMRDANVSLLIADRNLELALEPDLAQKITILYTDEIASLPEGELPPAPSPSAPFILLYTSGTTGTPKGVRLTHANLMALWSACRREFPQITGPDDRWSMYASYGFDAGFFSIFMPIAGGGAVCIVPDEIRLDMEALNGFYMRHKVTNAFMTTQVGRIFATTVDKTTIKTLTVGGEKLVPCAPPEGYRLYNLYGPTEGTVFSNFKLVDKLYTRVPIGRTLDDYRMYIVDKYGHRLPDGALGQMLIAGPQVGEGYLNLPEKTAAVFGANPYTTDPCFGRCYNTGDIVRVLPATGEADIIGRSDGQVKIRGFRIELSEVERAVRDFPGITDATVQAFDSPAGGKFIAAYVVSDNQIDVKALNEYIASVKPPYMVPEVTMQIPEIPLTRNQKVDRRALPEPVRTETAAAVADNREPNLLEKAIMEIVAEVLGHDDITVTAPLSLLGLTSISSIKLGAALHRRFGVSLRGADLVKNGTVASIEDAVLELLLSGPAQRDEAAQSRTELTAVPLTVSQQGVYADTQRNPESVSYNIPVCLAFDRSFDAHLLADTVRRVIEAHPYVKDAHFVIGAEDVEQTVVPSVDFHVEVRKMDKEEFEAYRSGYVKPFDLSKAPLCHIEAVETPEAVYLLLDIHHIVFDGSSLSVMLTQLKTLLEGGSIEPERMTYLDYAVEEERLLKGEEGKRAEEFFRRMLADCEAASDIPSDLPSGSDDDGSSKMYAHIDMDKISEFCRRHELTPAALMLAATCYATARFTTSKGAYISTISTGRSNPAYADTFGMFVKTVAVGMQIGDGTALQMAMRAKEVLEGAVENEIYPYARICADYGYAPNIMYEYQYGLVDYLVIDGKEVRRTLLDADTLKFKLAVRVEQDEETGEAYVVVHYRKALYSERLAGALCAAIAAVARAIIEHPDMKATQISMLAPDDLEKLRCLSVNAPAVEESVCLHQLMERQAQLNPGRKAVVAADRTLTYAELNDLAETVAANLQARCIGKGDRVLLLLSRTSRFFTSLYGVLKTGAAYIPSSPEYPEERIRSIVADSGAALIIDDLMAEELHKEKGAGFKSVEVSPDDTAYLIYTSGSTGKPKGVVLRHRGIVNYVTPDPANAHTHAIVNRATTVGSITTVAFDMALKEWGIALSNGLTTVFADDLQANDPVALAKLFADNGVDYFNTTPSRMMQYMELDDFRAMLSRCKVVICGAEKYPDSLISQLRECAPEAELFNTYGPTEITVSCNACCLTHTDSVSVGRPLRGYTEWIVDADGNLLPPGVTGELVIAGPNIAKGYDGAPELTAKAFVTREGLPAYLSGDYARWDENGNVVILGRKDTQVKLRGLRIELGEIVRVMGDIPGVGAVHVMIRKVAGRENLVAYYTLKPGVSLTPEEMKVAMASRLADYMVPSFMVEMERMPLTPNGKIDVRALPEPAVADREAGREAANELERLFVDAFKNVLGTDTVYATDNFFEIGGSSLTATRIMIAASKAGHRLLYADIFAHPTPEGLAQCVARNEGTATGAEENGDEGSTEARARYDYSAIDALLQRNTLQTFREGELRELGTVMLTGATGFAGIHVLREILTSYPDSRVVCLVRDSRKGIAAMERLEGLWFYYFGEPLAERFGDRLRVVSSDITSVTTDFDPGERIDTVINCAAIVKHFSAGTDIEDVNLHGVEKLIEWCSRSGAALVQTSTISVSGMVSRDRDDALLTERTLDLGQDLGGNKYVVSKFLAERAVLEATAAGRIRGKVVRLGNLASRERDGEFQVNFNTNGFMNRLKSMVIIGCYPYSAYDELKDISPIDDVARAIVMFSRTPDGCVLFHANNPNRYSLGNFYHEAALAGLSIHPVETEQYAEALEKAKANPEALGALVGLMAYDTLDNKLKGVGYSNMQSAQILLRMGMHWPVVSSDYVTKLVRALDTLGFFTW